MIIGMDFGTTNSGMAAYDGQKLHLIPLDHANANPTVARTALYVTNDRQVYIGRQAIDTYYTQNLNRPVQFDKVHVGEITLTFAEIGTFIRDVYVDKDIFEPGRLFLSFKMGLSSLNYLGTVIGRQFYFLEDIIALYLYVARQRAEKALKREIRSIVLGRPVRYALDAEANQLAQERMLKAAFRAGYDEVYLQYEPIAAAYHYESAIDTEQNVLIFDFGGGTLDLSVLRVGNPKTRAVLANGGLPIAGDVFDQKLVRAKLPSHFGEGSTYRNGDKQLPVPSSFYEAFNNWQDMLALQRPDFYESIKRIEQTSQNPYQIRALRDLISSSYALSMYDIVEGTKRDLSSALRSIIRLKGDGFNVMEPVTRSEFERIIRTDINTIADYVDEMIAKAGLNHSDIDAVIRTGGSSQIPAFVELLETRFGADKVRSIDTFSSVTSGLGIIAHRIERGEIDVPVHRREDYSTVEDITRDGLPAVDFEVMKKYISFTETQAEDEQPALGFVTLTRDRHVRAALDDPEGLPLADAGQVVAAPADDLLLLATSDYRFTLKTSRQLMSLDELGLSLADTEGFHLDVFGDEHVTSLSNWADFTPSDWALLVTNSGHFKAFQGEPLKKRMEQPVPYQIPRLRGAPLTFLDKQGDVFLFSATGRTVRLAATDIEPLEGRLMQAAGRDHIVAAFSFADPTSFLLVDASGYLLRVDSDDIAYADGFSTNGVKLSTRRILSVIPLGAQPALITNQRLLPLDIPDEEQWKVKLHKGEKVVSLLDLHAQPQPLA
ncbi:MAG: Hsp70 family protein [Anaerolineae bacterium]|nr:Hsp70 family protein [Anaerolineae bacterium]